MHFSDFLQNSAKEIDSYLEAFFTTWCNDVEHISPRLLPHSKALTEACLGGKRIRGALVMLGYSLGNEKRAGSGDIFRVAGAYEIFQAAILAHDDIIDKSELRRGKPSLYMKLDGGHMGVSKAICLGDIGFFLAFQSIADSHFSDNEKNRALSIFSRTMLETGIGELLDVELSDPKAEIGELEDIITIYTYKTAYYTITAPLLLGAALGSATKQQEDAIKEFGRNLGIAFQIQDDINDIFSDKKKLGKEAGGDIKEGKQTLLYLYAKEHGDREQKDLLEKYYGNSEIGGKEIELVKETLIKSGAFDYATGEAKRYAGLAKGFIGNVTDDKDYRRLFEEMSEYFVT